MHVELDNFLGDISVANWANEYKDTTKETTVTDAVMDTSANPSRKATVILFRESPYASLGVLQLSAKYDPSQRPG